ncbi:HD domain-containing phosphohydrolase [Vibrio sp. SCSIO 43136]|uniref:HD domain-containing phosphohydrolase n=1 Tax=Vibrio sp. SCSIO 43136 TaxID=2819101 RepID=UPI0020761862|nr:HD domain-containing phosphohydrolase [Vibrio sp. SCSIO 43136]USD64730.1 HD domain-containing protein [Vibrio sp. SCSIO 43136]
MQSTDIQPALPVENSLSQQLESIHQEIRTLLPKVDRISFTLYDSHLDMLRIYAASEISNHPRGTFNPMHLSQCPNLKICADSQTPRVIDNLSSIENPPRSYSQWLLEQGYLSSFSVPCYHQQAFIGFMNFNSFSAEVFDEEAQQQLQPFCEDIKALFSHEYSLVHTIIDSVEMAKQLYPSTNPDSHRHMSRVSLFAHLIAQDLAQAYKLDNEVVEHIHLFSRLHDIGKVTVPDMILHKPDRLSNHERFIMQSHIDKGIKIVENILRKLGNPEHVCVNTLKEILLYHHEFLDGSGYPNGLKGEDIPISARIVSVANIFDALTSHRPYQQAWCVPSALLEMEKMVAMGKLDGHCVNVLRDHQDYIADVLQRYPEIDPRDA